MRSRQLPAALAFFMLLLALAGCGKASVQAAFSHDTERFLIEISDQERSIRIRVGGGLAVSRPGRMGYPEGRFTTSQHAPLVFGVEDRDFAIDQGQMKCGPVVYGHVAGGQVVVFNRQGVFIDGKRRGDFPPGG